MKKTAKIVKGRERPKVDEREVEALVRELARPERLAREAEKLLRRLRDDPGLAAARFDGERLVAAAREAASPEALVDALVTDEERRRVRALLEARARAGGTIEELLPYRVGMHLLDAESPRNDRLRSVPGRQSPPGDPLAARLDPEPRSEVEHSCSTSEVGAERPASKNPFWFGVLSATAFELPLALYLRARPLAGVAAECRAASALPPFEAFLLGDERMAAVRKAAPRLDLEGILIHAMIGCAEAGEIVLPLEAALGGPIEAAKASRRRQALAGIGSTAPPAAEQAKTLMAAVEKDAVRAIPAYRAELAPRLDEAVRDAGDAATEHPGRARLARLLALHLALEALPAARNVPLMAAYEAAAPGAFDGGADWEKPLIHAILGRPLAVEGYRAYAERLAEKGSPRARDFAEAALAHFPGDAALEAARGAVGVERVAATG